MCAMLVLVSMFVFLVPRALGVDPLVVLGGDKGATEAAKAELALRFGLDKPLLAQYGDWATGLLSGDLGHDYVNRQDVRGLIAPRVPVTVGLVAISMVLAWIFGILLGTLSALRKNTGLDTGISMVSLLLASTPGFVMAIVSILVCARFFPSYSFVGSYGNAGEYVARIVLPAVVLSFVPMALIVRVTRSSMVEQMKQGYVRTARAKGLGRAAIIVRHGFRNAMPPVLTIASMMVGTAISGAVLVETVFSLPGLGSLLVSAIKEYNYPITQTLLLLLLFVFLLISFVMDAVLVLIDPRVSLRQGGLA
jgi:peptide/nickel transport system permease protein